MGDGVHVTYYTDPACPWSWAAEPQLRRVLVEFADHVHFTYVMGGLARELKDPGHELEATLEASAAGGQPVDPRVWLEGRAPTSTYPASLAVKAAAEQGLDGPYLRALREAIMLDGRACDRIDGLVDVARQVKGVDLTRFELDARSNAIVEAFGSDLERARAVPEEQLGSAGRVTFPSFEVEGRFGELRELVVAAGAPAGELPTVAELLGRFPRVTEPEVAACCGLSLPRAQAELWRLAGEMAAVPQRVLAATVWVAAG